MFPPDASHHFTPIAVETGGCESRLTRHACFLGLGLAHCSFYFGTTGWSVPPPEDFSCSPMSNVGLLLASWLLL